MSGAPRIARTRMNNTYAAHGRQRRLCRLRRLRHLRHIHHLQSLCRLRRLLHVVRHLYTTCPPELLQRLCHLRWLQPPTTPTATNAAYVASAACASQRLWHLVRHGRQRRRCRLHRLRHLRHLHHLQSLCRLRRLLHVVRHLYTTCPPELLQRLCHLRWLQPPTTPTATNAACVASAACASQRL